MLGSVCSLPGRTLFVLAMTTVSCAQNQDDTVANPPPTGSKKDGGPDVAPDTTTSDAPASDAGVDGGCMPKSCAQLGAQCGVAPNGCGGSVTCGDCPSGQTCGGGGPNQCGTSSCTPKTCAQLGASCGVVSDGCSAALNCGTCPIGWTCGAPGTPNQCVCTPVTCAAAGAECGDMPDGCGKTLACGDCPSGQICGGGGAANKCGTAPCVPYSCADVGAECGQTSDGCGGVLSCGTCQSPKTCGGAGEANVCGCTPTSCTAQGAQCGTIPDNCGGTLQCGGCPGNQACLSNVCGCPTGQHLCGAQCIAPGTCCTDADCSGLTVCATPGQACSCRTTPARIPIYRSYYAPSGDHFFSPSQSEGPNAGYVDEGIRFYLYSGPCQWGLNPFFRLLNTQSGEHFYTQSTLERDTLLGAGWSGEGEIGCIANAAVCDAVTLFRLVQPYGKHMFTTSTVERDALLAAGWMLEGPAGYVWLSP